MRLHACGPYLCDALNGVACLGLAVVLIVTERAQLPAALAQGVESRLNAFAADTSRLQSAAAGPSEDAGASVAPALSDERSATPADDQIAQSARIARGAPDADTEAQLPRDASAPEARAFAQTQASQSSTSATAVARPGPSAPVAKRASAVVPPIVRRKPAAPAAAKKGGARRKALVNRATKHKQRTAGAER